MILTVVAYKSGFTWAKVAAACACLKPYWGKPTVRNFREGEGNGRHPPYRALALLGVDNDHAILVSCDLHPILRVCSMASRRRGASGCLNALHAQSLF